jgi:nicotinamidase-related amidase
MEAGISLSRAALLLVDVQRDLLHEDGALARVGLPALRTEDRQRLLSQYRELVAAMRHAGRPIVWVKTALRADLVDSGHARSWLEPRREAAGEFLVEGSWVAELMDGLPVESSDYVVVKKSRILRNVHARKLIVTGGATTGCVWATVQDGLALGYDMTVVADAVYPPGAAGLAALARWCPVRPATDVLAELAADPVEE